MSNHHHNQDSHVNDESYFTEALNFYPKTGYVTFEPGPFEWLWGKAQP
jgi:hypothetical protein